jgi:acyl-CoA synthetase (AMP-forming)/AMP-acid ligase II
MNNKLNKALSLASANNPNNIAFKQGGTHITYENLYIGVINTANGLKKIGLTKGDRVMLVGNPCIHLAIVEHAAIILGITIIIIYPKCLSPKELEHIVLDVNPNVIVHDDYFASVVIDMPNKVNAKLIPCLNSPNQISIELMVNTLHNNSLSFQEADDEDPALIIYTGGTTGKPKGVVYTYGKMQSWIASTGTNSETTILENLAHGSGQGLFWATTAKSGCSIFLPSYPADADIVADIVEREKVTQLVLVGNLLPDILNTEKHDLKSVKLIMCSGAPISPKILHRAVEVFSSATILFQYAQTECGVISMLNVNTVVKNNTSKLLRSVGKPIDGVGIKIVNGSDEEVGVGELGEVVIKNKNMMKEYWNNPESTAETIKNGWLYSGDIGKIDKDGYLYLVDRKKDMVIVDGYNVYCIEVEKTLEEHSAVKHASVVGIADEENREVISAMLELNTSKSTNLEDIQKFCIDRLAAHKVPEKILIVNKIPRTTLYKWDKSKIKEMFKTHQ